MVSDLPRGCREHCQFIKEIVLLVGRCASIAPCSVIHIHSNFISVVTLSSP